MDEAPRCEDVDWASKEPVFGTDFTQIHQLDRKLNLDAVTELDAGDFSETDKNLQYVEMDDVLAPVPEFPYNWQHVRGSKPFRMKINCKALVVVSKDTGDVTEGKAIAYVDGKKVLEIDPKIVGWTHCNPQILFSDKEAADHEVVIAMDEGCEEKKLTILGFGYVK